MTNQHREPTDVDGTEAREYLLSAGWNRYDAICTKTNQEIFKFGWKKILVIQKIMADTGKSFTVVPGYVVSEYNTGEHDAVRCQPVPEREQKDIANLVRKKGFRGNINFNH